jgi:hypothetical protein
MLDRLQQLPSGVRSLLIEYYRGSGRARIQRRQQLAAQRGGNLNALRIVVSRIRTGLTVGLGPRSPLDPKGGDL